MGGVVEEVKERGIKGRDREEKDDEKGMKLNRSRNLGPQ